MAPALQSTAYLRNGYPTSDGKPMAETDWHRILMTALIQTLDDWYAKDKRIYVSGNLLIFYEQGNKRKHVSPDVFVVKGVAKHPRPNYLVWEEGKAPDFVIELTSSSTRAEDVKKKFHLYQDVLRVREYFLFDPLGDYLKPPFRGYRLMRGKFQSIPMVQGRLPSQVVNLHLERDGKDLRLYDPAKWQWLPTPGEALATATTALVQAENARLQAENTRLQAENARLLAEAENQRLRRQMQELRYRRRNDS